MKKCYICGKMATSKEHAPPKCFFPKGSIIGDLITVDSCKTHNEEFSKDDEYVRNLISMMIGNNNLGEEILFSKTKSSLNRSPKLASFMFKNIQKVKAQKIGSNEIVPTVSFEFDRNRLDKVIRKIAYAVYYHKFKKQWNKRLKTGSASLITDKFETIDLDEYVRVNQNKIPNNIFKGDNKSIFKYCFLEVPNLKGVDEILSLIFYENFEIWIFSNSESNSYSL